jgi:hypothetical protein
VLGDTPHLSIDPPTCLAAHMNDISACETRRGLAENRQHDNMERTTAAANGASFVSLNALVCSYDPCPVLAGNVVMWRNASHLTATWVSGLWQSLAAVVIAAMAPTALAPAENRSEGAALRPLADIGGRRWIRRPNRLDLAAGADREGSQVVSPVDLADRRRIAHHDASAGWSAPCKGSQCPFFWALRYPAYPVS